MMWLVLICASFFELAFTVCMKLSNGLKNVKFTVLPAICSCASIGLLSVATKTLPLGVSYAVWTGLGTLKRAKALKNSSSWPWSSSASSALNWHEKTTPTCLRTHSDKWGLLAIEDMLKCLLPYLSPLGSGLPVNTALSFSTKALMPST